LGVFFESLNSVTLVTRDLRHLSWKMEPAPYGTDVKVAIESMCDRLRVLLGIQIRCNIDSDAALKLSGLIDSVAPIVQEGISNAYRHGHADHVEVSFKDKIKYILIIIKDDGIGFDPYKCSNLGQGLKNMRSRIEALGGQMEIIGKFGIGTELHFSILHEARV
jgi:two-component system, NarL family, sensor kinase